MALQLRQIVERVDPAQFARMDQGREPPRSLILESMDFSIDAAKFACSCAME